jgi:hypothetical protein
VREQAERRARDQGPLASRTDEPTVIAFPAPALVPELVPGSTPKRGSTHAEPFASAAIPFPRVASGGARTP